MQFHKSACTCVCVYVCVGDSRDNYCCLINVVKEAKQTVFVQCLYAILTFSEPNFYGTKTDLGNINMCFSF